MESIASVVLSAIMVLAIIVLLFSNLFRRKPSKKPSAKGKKPPECRSQRFRREAEEIREETEQLRVARSPLSTPEAVAGLIERLDLLHAEADYLDAQLDRKEEVAKARLAEKIQQVENEIKRLKLQGASMDKIKKAQKRLEDLIKQA